jgi:hypothetical protein
MPLSNGTAGSAFPSATRFGTELKFHIKIPYERVIHSSHVLSVHVMTDDRDAINVVSSRLSLIEDSTLETPC